jgi:hypothetical protein
MESQPKKIMTGNCLIDLLLHGTWFYFRFVGGMRCPKLDLLLHGPWYYFRFVGCMRCPTLDLLLHGTWSYFSLSGVCVALHLTLHMLILDCDHIW